MTELLNDVFAPYFFGDCCFSFINLSIMMFSLITNANLQNYLMEIPLVTAGMSQLFFVLYFGDRLIDETSALADAVYSSKWYAKSVSHQKKVLLVIMRSQRPQTLHFGHDFIVANIYLFSQV